MSVKRHKRGVGTTTGRVANPGAIPAEVHIIGRRYMELILSFSPINYNKEVTRLGLSIVGGQYQSSDRAG